MHSLLDPMTDLSLTVCHSSSSISCVWSLSGEWIVDSAVRPKSHLSAKHVLIQWDLWAPRYKQQAEARESQPSKPNDSTLWSAMCCQHEGCHPDLFWLVTLNLWETKWGEKDEDSLVWVCVQHSLTTVLYETPDVVFHWKVWRTIRSITSQTLFCFFGSPEQIEPNLLHIRNDLLLPLSAATKPLQDRSSLEMRSHPFLWWPSLKVTGPRRPLLSLCMQPKFWKTGQLLVSCAPLKQVALPSFHYKKLFFSWLREKHWRRSWI